MATERKRGGFPENFLLYWPPRVWILPFRVIFGPMASEESSIMRVPDFTRLNFWLSGETLLRLLVLAILPKRKAPIVRGF